MSRVTPPGQRIARPGPGNGCRPMKTVRQTQFVAKRPHLVLEQFAQRLDKLHVHAIRQTADIVVRLDGGGRASGKRHALDHVGVQCALGEEISATELLGLAFKQLDEQPPDRLALGLRVGFALQRVQKYICASTSTSGIW